jgi:hypothetical protein
MHTLSGVRAARAAVGGGRRRCVRGSATHERADGGWETSTVEGLFGGVGRCGVLRSRWRPYRSGRASRRRGREMRCTFEVYARPGRVMWKGVDDSAGDVSVAASVVSGTSSDFAGRREVGCGRTLLSVAKVGEALGCGPAVDGGTVGEACGDTRCTRGFSEGRHEVGATRRRRSLHPSPRLTAAKRPERVTRACEKVARTAVCAVRTTRTSGFGPMKRHPQGVCRHEHPTRSGSAGRAEASQGARISA